MRTRIVAYKPFGAKLPAVPDPLEVQIVTPLGETPTAAVHYHRGGLNAARLDGDVELGFEYNNGTTWVEPPASRFQSFQGSFDHLESTPTRKYTPLGLDQALGGATLVGITGLPVDADGKHQFLSANAGQIMATVIAHAKSQGWGAGISIDFDSAKDSSGSPWVGILTLAYASTLKLSTILDNLSTQGLCDYRFEGRTLRVFNPNTVMGRDLTVGANPVRLLVADGQTSAPEEWSDEDRCTHVVVIGEGGRRWTFTNGSTHPLGRVDKVIEQGGVTDEGTASLLAQAALLAGAQTRISYTREFTITPESRIVPYRDYLPGDWVLAQRGTALEKLRVMSVSLTVGANGVTGHVVLGDRLDDLLAKVAKRQTGITGGASVGGSGVRPAPEGPDIAIPAAPTGLVVAPDAYIDNAGNARGVVALNWAHSGKNVGGVVMGIDKFNVEYRINELGKPWLFMTSTPTMDAAYSPLALFKGDGVTPEQYGFRVQARGSNGRLSAFSAVTAVEMQPDTTPPPVPYFASADVTTWLRTITVRWRGKGTLTGTDQVAMPRDFDYINVYQASSASMLGKVMVGQIRSNGLWQSDTMPLATVYYALTAVDRSGNESALSVSRAITPVANVDVEAIVSEIDAAKIVLKNVGESSLLANSVTANKIVGLSITAEKIAALAVSTDKLAANAVTADKADIGSLRAGILTANSVIASMIKGDAINGKTITGATFQTAVNDSEGIKFNSTGIFAYKPTDFGQPSASFRVIAATGAVFMSGATISSGKGKANIIINPDQGIRLYDESNNETMWQDPATGDLIMRGALTSRSFAGNQLWAGADMRNSGASGVAARPGIVFKSDASESRAASIERDGAWGALILNSPSSSTGSYVGQSSISTANHGIKMWASKAGQQAGPNIADSEMLALNAADKDWYIGGGGFNTQGDYRIRSFGTSMSIRRNSNHQLVFSSDRSTSLSTSNLDVAGSFYATSKNFKIRHPSKPGMDLLHGVTESPWAGVEYWGDATIDADGTAIVELPDYFEALTKTGRRDAFLQPKGTWCELTASDVKDGAFTVTGTPGQRFSWLVKAERHGADFAIEQPTEPLEGETNDA